MSPGIFLCTPLVYSYNNWVKICAHIGRTRPKNVRPVAEMCAPGAECTINFEHCSLIEVSWKTYTKPFPIFTPTSSIPSITSIRSCESNADRASCVCRHKSSRVQDMSACARQSNQKPEKQSETREAIAVTSTKVYGLDYISVHLIIPGGRNNLKH